MQGSNIIQIDFALSEQQWQHMFFPNQDPQKPENLPARWTPTTYSTSRDINSIDTSITNPITHL